MAKRSKAVHSWFNRQLVQLKELGKRGGLPSFVMVALWIAFTVFILSFLLMFVDLKPKVDENFFFSSNDPQFRAEKAISAIFPQPPQFVIGVKGPIRSKTYYERIRSLSDTLLSLDEVFSVQSLSNGPESFEDALDSSLWRRVLISDDEKATFISAFIKDVDPEVIVPKIEKIQQIFNEPDFQVMISGAPYIMELIRRNLLRDLKIFSAAAFVVFGIVMLLIFRSWRILAGTLIASVNASASTLILARILHIEIGPLTANLSTIVFVLTLSHIVFLTFNWNSVNQWAKTGESGSTTWRAMMVTLNGSFWSMATTLLGFVSLLFVQATPLRQLGVSGAMGTLISFASAYLIYPWFLHLDEVLLRPQEETRPFKRIRIYRKMRQLQPYVVGFIVLTALFSVAGLFRLNTDPSLFSYFKKGSALRTGLEYIDRNGGSSPLKIVVADQKKRKFNTDQAYKELWKLHKALELDPAVGNVVSLPIILAEAKRSPLTMLLTMEWLLKILESPNFGEVAKYFITEDRDKALFILRMREMDRHVSRLQIVDRIKAAVHEDGFFPVFVGGVYLLQGKLSQLLASSLISGLTLLIGMFFVMGWFLSRNWRTTFALFIALCIIPVCMLGILGHLRVPLDVISAPAANLAIAMGVDAMIHVIIAVRRLKGRGVGDHRAWNQAISKLWQPVFSSALIVSAGFGIFALSNFPPTQRFGLSVVLGALLSPISTLFVLPYFAAYFPGFSKWRRKWPFHFKA